eukprot:403348259
MGQINEVHRKILQQVKVSCVNKDLGCNEKSLVSDLWKHETTTCKFLQRAANKKNQCPSCQVHLNGYEEKRIHICNQMDLLLCHKHQDNYNLTADRITNMEDVQKYISGVQCYICSNLMKNPSCLTISKQLVKINLTAVPENFITKNWKVMRRLVRNVSYVNKNAKFVTRYMIKLSSINVTKN